jgi:endonuclease/exonuclease/phosphatase family metal-dependent hydrolase
VVKTEGSWRRRARRVLGWLCWLYLALLLAVWGLMIGWGDEWWPATMLMFLGRRVWGLPLVPLALAAAVFRPRLLWVTFASALVVVWPLMGLCLPWRTLRPGPAGEFHCRVLTCNVHRNPFGIRTALDEAGPDIIALQDWPEHAEPRDFKAGGWHVQTLGQFLLASRYPIRELTELKPPVVPANTVVRAQLETPAGVVRFFNLHLATPRQALVAVRLQGWRGGPELQANSDVRRQQSAAVADWIAEGAGPLLVAGDFNTPPESTTFRDFWGRYTDAFAEAGLGWGYSYHMNRTALRIDHILAGPGWRCRACRVGPEVGSEHLPVIADLDWVGGSP